MFAAIFTVSFTSLSIVVGMCVAWGCLRRQLRGQDVRFRERLHTQATVIEDQAATINAYREVVSVTMGELRRGEAPSSRRRPLG
jgi:hypothetical protein